MIYRSRSQLRPHAPRQRRIRPPPVASNASRRVSLLARSESVLRRRSTQVVTSAGASSSALASTVSGTVTIRRPSRSSNERALMTVSPATRCVPACRVRSAPHGPPGFPHPRPQRGRRHADTARRLRLPVCSLLVRSGRLPRADREARNTRNRASQALEWACDPPCGGCGSQAPYWPVSNQTPPNDCGSRRCALSPCTTRISVRTSAAYCSSSSWSRSGEAVPE